MTYQVRNLRREQEDPLGRPYWEAELVTGPRRRDRVAVDRKFGSWQGVRRDGSRFELPREIAARLAEKVRPTENAERRAREKAAEAAKRQPVAA